jgi:hypothetical protein
MAETPIVAAPSIRDIERAIQMEAAKPEPNLKVINELIDVSKTILQQSGGPLRQPTIPERITAEISAEPAWKQALLGASTTPVRMVQGAGTMPAPVMGPSTMPTGRYSAPTLPQGEKFTPQDIEEVKIIREATPMTKLGGMFGDIGSYAVLPTRGINMATGGRQMVSRGGQMADVAATSAGIQALTSPENRGPAAAWGALAGIAPGVAAVGQRALPQGAGGVRAPQVQGEALLRQFGDESENLIRALKGEYAPVPGVSGSASVVTKDPRLQVLETGSRTGQGQMWMPFDKANEEARFNALMKAAGTQAERDALVAERKRVTSPMREGAFTEAATTPDTLSMAPSINKMRETVNELKTGEQRPNPAVQKVVSYVERELFNPQGTTPQQLYTVRKVLTGQLKTGANEEIGAAAAVSRKETMNLVNQIDETLNSLSGGKWSDYLQKYSDMSKEVSSKNALQNAIDDMTINLAQGRVPPALSGKTGEQTLSRAVNKYALEDFGAKTIDQLTPEARRIIEALKDDLARTAAGMNARATGGPGTAQYLAAQGRAKGLASQLVRTGAGAVTGGPVGGIAANVAGDLVSTALARSGEEGAQILARLLQDPRYLAAMLEKARKSQTQLNVAGQLGAGGAAGGSAATQQRLPF